LAKHANDSIANDHARIVFLDRDGTINQFRPGYVKNLAEFVILPDVARNLARLSEKGFKLIVVTNQSAVGRGLLSQAELEKIHNFMIASLRSDGCKIDNIYYCPHTPRDHCFCRKPKIAMLEKASREYGHIDLHNSWIIGDSNSDIKAGQLFGIRTLKIPTNTGLEYAVNYILSEMG